MSYSLSAISDLPMLPISEYSPPSETLGNTYTTIQNTVLSQFDNIFIEVSRSGSSYKVSLSAILKYVLDVFSDVDNSPYIRINGEQRNITFSNTVNAPIDSILLKDDKRLDTNFLRVDGNIEHGSLVPYVKIHDEGRTMAPGSTFSISTGTLPLKITNTYNGKSNVISACATSAIWN